MPRRGGARLSTDQACGEEIKNKKNRQREKREAKRCGDLKCEINGPGEEEKPKAG